MFREYLENNGFARLVRAAFEDGFLNGEIDPKTAMSSTSASTFATIAAKCAPEALQVAKVVDDTPPKDVEFVTDKPKETKFRDVSLRSILFDSWNSGRFTKNSLMQQGTETFDVWRNRVANIASFAKTESRRFAVTIARTYADLTIAGNEGTKWMLMTDKDITVGMYHGPELKKGDIIEHAFETACRVTEINYEVDHNVSARFNDCKFVFVERVTQTSPLSALYGDLKVGDLADFGINAPRGAKSVTVMPSAIRAKPVVRHEDSAVSCEVLDQPVSTVVKVEMSPKSVVVVGDPERPATEADVKEVQEMLSKVANDPNMTIVTHGPNLPAVTDNLGWDEKNVEHKSVKPAKKKKATKRRKK